MALFFLKSTAGHHLKDAPGGDTFLTHDPAQLDRGKTVFAERCARCHSSKIPEPAAGLDPDGCSGKDYMNCWNRYWTWTKTDDFKTKMQAIVHQPNFLEGNYLSTDQRVPVTLLKTNACSPLATNAIAGNIWDNFSSSTYKDLPSAGSITVYHPYTGDPSSYALPAGGRGYTRPPSLISAWSTAPFLLNNSVGNFEASPAVDARMRSFQDSIEKMLWPERRDRDSLLPDKLPGTMDRTTEQSYISIPAGFIPPSLRPLLSSGSRLLPAVFGEESIRVGPIPKGTPVDLLANLDLLGEGLGPADKVKHQQRVISLLVKLKLALASLPANASDDQARKAFADLVPELLALNKCPDFVVNRGHYFGTSYFQEEPALSDSDRRALIEFIKTF
jgi:hypothetical protein